MRRPRPPRGCRAIGKKNGTWPPIVTERCWVEYLNLGKREDKEAELNRMSLTFAVFNRYYYDYEIKEN
jgi:hypothetical protein